MDVGKPGSTIMPDHEEHILPPVGVDPGISRRHFPLECQVLHSNAWRVLLYPYLQSMQVFCSLLTDNVMTFSHCLRKRRHLEVM